MLAFHDFVRGFSWNLVCGARGMEFRFTILKLGLEGLMVQDLGFIP